MSEQFESLRILRIRCKNHYLFGDMEFDFTNNGKPVDTIIIAGENGAGKSTLLDIIFNLTGGQTNLFVGEYEADVIYNGQFTTYGFQANNQRRTFIQHSPNLGINRLVSIFSDVEINYNKPRAIGAVTSKNLDAVSSSQKSQANLALEIEQLLIDVQALDSEDIAYEVREAKKNGLGLDAVNTEKRISRFANAFNVMFDNQFTWGGIENKNGKQIFFYNKQKQKIMLGDLSSGEKQIVYRGAYLLKDKNLLKGATVLIDEPEISLHPEWQKKIMDYYKRIFTDENGMQTSQIFAVTHSPFIIHNENRYNDKIIIIKKDSNGKIYVEDNPSYYDCNSVKVVEDAFNIQDFSDIHLPIVYLEGITDEQYFNEAYRVFNFTFPVKFKAIGDNKNGKSQGAGASHLDNAIKYLINNNEMNTTFIALYDCDVNGDKNSDHSKVHCRKMTKNETASVFEIGVENLLVLPKDFDYDKYKIIKPYKKNGLENTICDWNKTALANDILTLSEQEKRSILANIKAEIDKIQIIINEDAHK